MASEKMIVETELVESVPVEEVYAESDVITDAVGEEEAVVEEEAAVEEEALVEEDDIISSDATFEEMLGDVFLDDEAAPRVSSDDSAIASCNSPDIYEHFQAWSEIQAAMNEKSPRFSVVMRGPSGSLREKESVVSSVTFEEAITAEEITAPADESSTSWFGAGSWFGSSEAEPEKNVAEENEEKTVAFAEKEESEKEDEETHVAVQSDADGEETDEEESSWFGGFFGTAAENADTDSVEEKIDETHTSDADKVAEAAIEHKEASSSWFGGLLG